VLDDGRVVSVEAAAPTNQLLSRIVRLRLGYEGAPEAVPRSLILKIPLPGDRNDRPFVQGASEVAFYAKVAPAMPAGLVPRCFTATGRTRHGNGTCCSKISPTRTRSQRHGRCHPMMRREIGRASCRERV